MLVEFQKINDELYVGTYSVDPLMVEGTIREYGEKDFQWHVDYMGGREIAHGTAVSLKQAKFLAGEAYTKELKMKYPQMFPSFAPRRTL